jgi:hypothetical protein
VLGDDFLEALDPGIGMSQRSGGEANMIRLSGGMAMYDQGRRFASLDVEPFRAWRALGRVDLGVPACGREEAAMQCEAEDRVIAWQPRLPDVHSNGHDRFEARPDGSEYEFVS